MQWMETISPRPAVFLSISAVGIYGDRPGEVLGEGASPDPAQKFRARVCRAWEAEARAAATLGIRVVILRLGNVLHPSGGYLGNLCRAYRWLPLFGLGAASNMFSWISRGDAIRLIDFVLRHEEAQGPVNATAPRPVSQGELTRLLAEKLQKVYWGQLPGWMFRVMLGEFSSAFLDSQDVRPAQALALGFTFVDSLLVQAL